MRLHKSNSPIVCKMKKHVWNICAAIMWTRWGGCFHVLAASGAAAPPPSPPAPPPTPHPLSPLTFIHILYHHLESVSAGGGAIVRVTCYDGLCKFQSGAGHKLELKVKMVKRSNTVWSTRKNIWSRRANILHIYFSLWLPVSQSWVKIYFCAFLSSSSMFCCNVQMDSTDVFWQQFVPLFCPGSAKKPSASLLTECLRTDLSPRLAVAHKLSVSPAPLRPPCFLNPRHRLYLKR